MIELKKIIIQDKIISMSRNIQSFKFPKKLKDSDEAATIVSLVKKTCDSLFDNNIIYTVDLSDFEKECLVYSKTASKNLINNNFSGIIINKKHDLKVFINEFDHIKIVCNRKDSSFDQLFKVISVLDDEISKEIPYLYDNKYGYLTSQLNLIGTGLRASFKVFLFASVKNNNLQRIINVTEKYDLILFNNLESLQSTYDYTFEFMNKHAINLSEIDILNNIKNAINEILIIEEEEIKKLIYTKGIEIKDLINRSLSILKNAYILDYPEFLRNLSNIRIGIILEIFNLKDNDINILNEKVSPVNLCRKLNNEKLNNNNEERAEIVRKFFEGVECLRK